MWQDVGISFFSSILPHFFVEVYEVVMSTMGKINFREPSGAAAYCAPDSIAWKVFKNPISVFIGGITAVLMEFVEPRIRSGVWDHSIFKKQPLKRIHNTGMATMVSIYGPQAMAKKMIANITRMHARVEGATPTGVLYRALDPQLMNWVQATVSYGFMHSYHTYVEELSGAKRDQLFEEFLPIAHLFGAEGAPAKESEMYEMMRVLSSRFESSPIVHDFLHIASRNSILPWYLKPLQKAFVRAAIDILPPEIRSALELGKNFDLRGWERRLITLLAGFLDKRPNAAAPPAQSCLRMGLPVDYLYRTRA